MDSFSKKIPARFATILLLLVVASPVISAKDSSPLISSPVSLGSNLLDAEIDNEIRSLQDSNATEPEDGESVEMAALAAECMCLEGNVFCMTADALKHCRCDSEGVYCKEDNDDDDDDDDDHEKPWGTVILMSLIINLTTLAGTVVVGGHWTRNVLCPTWNASKRVGTLWANVIIPMFACGTLMATTFFLLLPEALHMIASTFGPGSDEETKYTWRWGASILGGFFFPVILHALFPDPSHNHTQSHSHKDDSEKSEVAAVPVTDGEKDGPNNTKTDEDSEEVIEPDDDDEYVTICGCFRLKNLSLFISMNLGEMLHNFTDGIFVGAAYVGCGSTLGDSVVLATVIHEIPNQLAGYLVMVNQNGINPILALAINFMFGLSVLLGGLVVLALDLGNLAIGSIFAIGGGIFLHVAIFEMLGTADRGIAKQSDWVWVTLAFVLGTVVIGLVLINHEHCDGHQH